MKRLLEAAGRGFILVFGASLVTYASGIFEAPSPEAALALSIAALGASVAAGLTALKEFVPQFSWRTILPSVVPIAWVARLDIFTIAVVGILIVSTTDILTQAPDLSAWPALFTAALTGAIAAGFRTVVALGTKNETPAPSTGFGS